MSLYVYTLACFSSVVEAVLWGCRHQVDAGPLNLSHVKRKTSGRLFVAHDPGLFLAPFPYTCRYRTRSLMEHVNIQIPAFIALVCFFRTFLFVISLHPKLLILWS